MLVEVTVKLELSSGPDQHWWKFSLLISHLASPLGCGGKCGDLWRRPRCAAARCKILPPLLLLLLLLHLHLLPPPPPPPARRHVHQEEHQEEAAAATASAAPQLTGAAASRSHLSWARAP